MKKFTATLSRSQNRPGWNVIFKHPLLKNNVGQPGRRVRRGLDTTVIEEAEVLVGQLNDILSDNSFWSLSQKDRASQLFNPIITAAFYDKLLPEVFDYWETRNNVIAIPNSEDGYTRALLLGTTGSGKTTLVRQLIGTDPLKERFPSTSAAKTTIADIEIINDESDYEAIITFIGQEQIVQYVEECITSAVTSQVNGKNKNELVRKFLEHSEQRFRLNYLLGNYQFTNSEVLIEDLEDEDEDSEMFSEESEIDENTKKKINEKLETIIENLSILADELIEYVVKTLDINVKELNPADFNEFLEILEYEIYENHKFSKRFYDLVDNITDEIEKKFLLIESGDITRRNGWPLSWSLKTDDRKTFIKRVNKFSSNYAPNFGSLLTPLVNGIRIRGKFSPSWDSENLTKLVLFDGEGLGHTPNSSSSVSTSLTKKFKESDSIILVDNAAQPMQAAPTSVLRSLVSSGNVNKLIVAFTHFDEVKGPNLPNSAARKEHVRISLENSINSIGRDLGKYAENLLTKRVVEGVVFLSNIHEPISAKSQLTLSELNKLMFLLRTQTEIVDLSEISVKYDDANLVLSILQGLKDFHEPWDARLGYSRSDVVKLEHWSRIKALTRRLGILGQDEYMHLKPVADLIRTLSEHILTFITHPVEIFPKPVADKQKDEAISKIAREVFDRIQQFSEEVLFRAQTARWSKAYYYRGKGSSFERADEIHKIYNKNLPIPEEVPSVDSNLFLNKLRKVIREGIEAGGGNLS